MNPDRAPTSWTAPWRALPAALLATLLSVPLAAQGPTPVRVEPVKIETVEDLALVTGDLRAERRSLVAAQESGLILEIGAREGMRVSRGDRLARLDCERLERERAAMVALRVATAAEHTERAAQLEQESRDVSALESLSSRNATNPKELADSRSAVRIAEARLARVGAALDGIDAQLSLIARRIADSEILAPFDGVVVEMHVEVGEWIKAGDPATELVSTGRIEAWLNVPESLRGVLVESLLGTNGTANGHIPPAIEVRVDSIGRRYTGEAPRLVPRIDATSRNFPVILSIPDPEGWLAPGMSITAYVPTGRGGEHLLVHKDAILRRGTGPFVFVARTLGPGGPPQAIPLPVTELFPSGDFIAVFAPGLAPGDPTIVEGNERLFPMMPVAPGGGAPSGDPGAEARPAGTAGPKGAGR